MDYWELEYIQQPHAHEPCNSSDEDIGKCARSMIGGLCFESLLFGKPRPKKYARKGAAHAGTVWTDYNSSYERNKAVTDCVNIHRLLGALPRSFELLRGFFCALRG